MSREFWSFGIYTILSVVIMNGTFQWLEQKNAMTSDIALEKAEQSLQQFYVKNGKNAQGIRLTDAVAPSVKKQNWQFQFQPSQGKPITVEVAENGQASVLKPTIR